MLVAFGLRYGVPMIYDLGLRKIFLLTYVLWLPLLGWTAYFARRTSQKLMLLAALAVICPVSATLGGNWTGAWVMNMVQIPVMAVRDAATLYEHPGACAAMFPITFPLYVLEHAIFTTVHALDLLVFPGERHGYRSPEARRYAYRRVVDYFLAHL